MSFERKSKPISRWRREPVSRRRFLGYLIGGISGVVAAAVAFPLVGYFLSPAWKKSKVLLTPIAHISDIPVGKPTFVTYEQRIRDGWYISTLSKGAWVVRKNSDEFVVFDPRCTHLNCPYYWGWTSHGSAEENGVDLFF